jgi:sarcosine oxidase subunit beta
MSLSCASIILQMSLPERADVIVVGAGMLGCSAALHLKQAGVSDVLLLERDDLAQATSSAGAGFVGVWGAGYVGSWGDPEIALEWYALDFYRELADADFDFDYKTNGNLWVATTAAAWDRHIAVIAEHSAVADRTTLSADEVEEVTGIIAGAEVVGGVLHPRGGQVSAPKATRAVAERFIHAGGKIEVRRPASRILIQHGRVVGIDTPRGRIDTGTVVLAAGAWTNTVLHEHGIWIPMVPLVASRIVTEPLGVPPTMPTLMLQECEFIWLREERGGLMWGCSYEIPPRYDLVDGDPPDRLDGLSLDGVLHARSVGDGIARVIPALARHRSLTIAQGAPTYTADLRGVVGRVPGIEGLYVIGGCNEAGITHGPGYGRLVADEIALGEATLTDIDAFRIGRFGDDIVGPNDVVAAIADTNSIFTVGKP